MNGPFRHPDLGPVPVLCEGRLIDFQTDWGGGKEEISSMTLTSIPHRNICQEIVLRELNGTEETEVCSLA